jgi:BirA family biotin operon repressor/biotin-[acetyl-CoA-carboxylase] ligase
VNLQGTQIGHRVVRLARTPSTQLEARALLEEGAAHGVVVVADAQVAGRGRRGRHWVEPAVGLYASVVLRPALVMRHAPRVTMLACAALLDALAACAVEARVKWPNDVVIAHEVAGPLGPFRKVSGVLVEAVDVGARLESAVLGIGVNVRAPTGGFTGELSTLAGALDGAGFAGTRDALLDALLPALDARLATAADDEAFARCIGLLRSRSATLGSRVRVDDARPRAGDAVDLDDDGALLVRDDLGHVHRVVAGDVWPDDVVGARGRVHRV